MNSYGEILCKHTKSFASKRKIKKIPKLKINYKNIQIKQHSKVTYLGCILDETMSGESVALKVINKIYSRLKFLNRKNKFLAPVLRRLLCNALIQPHLIMRRQLGILTSPKK